MRTVQQDKEEAVKSGSRQGNSQSSSPTDLNELDFVFVIESVFGQDRPVRSTNPNRLLTVKILPFLGRQQVHDADDTSAIFQADETPA